MFIQALRRQRAAVTPIFLVALRAHRRDLKVMLNHPQEMA